MCIRDRNSTVFALANTITFVYRKPSFLVCTEVTERSGVISTSCLALDKDIRAFSCTRSMRLSNRVTLALRPCSCDLPSKRGFISRAFLSLLTDLANFPLHISEDHIVKELHTARLLNLARVPSY